VTPTEARAIAKEAYITVFRWWIATASNTPTSWTATTRSSKPLGTKSET